jgi:A/G-specific adenine glycosylase
MPRSPRTAPDAGQRPRAHPPLDARQIAALQERILGWYAEHRRDLPWRDTTDPYAILVSEVMLQQTQVARVVPAYATFLAEWPTLDALAAATLADVLRCWRGLGYNNRAERLWRCARACVERCAPDRAAALPDTLDELAALPGIGPYTARAILAFAHDADVAAVDANVRRVLTHELALPADLSPADLQRVADEVLPRGRSRDWHNALMDYGSLVLTARVTGVSPRTRQSAFEGSRRWYRSRLLRAVLDGGPQSRCALAALLGVDEHVVDDLVDGLERDGLVRRGPGGIGVA